MVFGNLYDDKIDIWAVGILSYELCVGQAPFSKKSQIETYENILSVEYIYFFLF